MKETNITNNELTKGICLIFNELIYYVAYSVKSTGIGYMYIGLLLFQK
jgi:hypothetical protein